MNEIDTQAWRHIMRKQIILVTAAFFLFCGLFLTGPATGSSTHAAKATKLVVAMHDPGCHWFMTGSMDHRTYSKTAVRTGPVNLVNLDEAALIVKGPAGTTHDKVGATMTLKAKGVYKITMVKQASDDNHLKLTIN
jgi:hypothetical protein